MADPQLEDAKSTVHRLQRYACQFVCPLYRVRATGETALVGTGLAVAIDNATLLLTCEHVIAPIVAEQSVVACADQPQERPVQVTEWQMAAEPVDLAVAKLPLDFFSGTRVTPLPLARIRQSSPNSQKRFIQGWPCVRSRALPSVTRVVSSPLSYLTVVRESESSRYLPTRHFAVDYQADKMQDAEGRRIGFIDPAGLSGSPVWEVAETTEQLRQISVVGVVFLFNEEGSLIAVRCEEIWAFLRARFPEL